MSIPEPTIRFATENAILLQFAEPPLNEAELPLQRRICQLANRLRNHPLTADLLQDAVPGPGSLLLSLYDGRKARRLLRTAETLWADLDDDEVTARCIDIPVVYGGAYGPDLAAVAAHCSLPPEEIIRRHSSRVYDVLNLGFLPGFAYLGGLDPALAIARKSTPAARIRAGSVAIGGQHTGIYPVASPGGWHVIGHTGVILFDPQRDPPCLLQPGDQVRFVMTDAEQTHD